MHTSLRFFYFLKKVMMILEYDSKHCPLCSSPNMSYGDPQVQDQAESIELPITCNKCKSQWIEVFTCSTAKLASDL